jgi:N6-L-threonylcarbamoyladenine synthase
MILAIETSCDETAAAVVEKDGGLVSVLGEAVASSQEMHVKTGGIVPEVAAREQLKAILPVIQEALLQASDKTKEVASSSQPTSDQVELGKSVAGVVARENTNAKEFISEWAKENIDSIAVTTGPGLIGSLLVGVETAKTLALAWNKPLIPVNHVLGHVYANWITRSQELGVRSQEKNLEFPVLALVVSGGHTDLYWMESHQSIKWLGGTRDDAAGECMDKGAKILGLPYPGGPNIAKAADEYLKLGEIKKILPRPLLYEDNLDMSFSGLKIALSREVGKVEMNDQNRSWLAAELQEAVVEVLAGKLKSAADKLQPKTVMLAGGVAANLRLRNRLIDWCRAENTNLLIPEIKYCTDNAVMIGAAACFQNKPGEVFDVKADPGYELAVNC